MTAPHPRAASDGGPLRYALAAAARGWHVFPVAPGTKRPAIPAAHGRHDRLRATCRGACGRLGHGVHDATSDPQVIRDWWTNLPDANVGIATGPSGLVVLDLDMPKPGTAPGPGSGALEPRDGVESLAELCRRAEQPMPVDTFTVRTGSRGLHLYFTAPVGLRLQNTSGAAGRGLGWCIDTRADGGYVIGPGSTVDRPGGPGRYTVVNHARPATLPTWVAERLVTPSRKLAANAAVPTRIWQPVGYGGAALRGEVQTVRNARPGHRNDVLNRAAFRLGRLAGGGMLDAELAVEALQEAAESTGLPQCEAAATIASGLGAGITHPVQPPDGGA